MDKRGAWSDVPRFLSALLFSQANDKMTIDHENEKTEKEACVKCSLFYSDKNGRHGEENGRCMI